MVRRKRLKPTQVKRAHTRRLTAALILVLFAVDTTAPGVIRAAPAPLPPVSPRAPGPGSEGGSGQQPPQFDPMWNKTGERVPREVKDKEKQTAETWCEKESTQPHSSGQGFIDTNELVVTYNDATTGTKTTIRRTESRPSQGLPPPGLSSVTDVSVHWEITIESPGRPRRIIRYDLTGLPNEQRYERIGDEPTDVRPPRDSDFSNPQGSGRRGSLQPTIFSRQLARVAQQASRRESSAPVLLAATTEKEPAPQLKTQTRAEPAVVNVKIVTYGDPPGEVFIHLDPGPQTTPEQIVTGTPVITWTPEDGEGPKTHTGIPGGIPMIFYPPGTPMTGVPGQPPLTTGKPVKQPPVTTGGPVGQPPGTTPGGTPGQPPGTGTPIIGIPITPGTTIHVGWGWAHTSITSSGIERCVNQTGTGSRASGPPQTASVPQAPSKPASGSVPKQECTWVTVPREDVPDFAKAVRQKQTQSDDSLAAPLRHQSKATQPCPAAGQRGTLQLESLRRFAAAAPSHATRGIQVAATGDAASPVRSPEGPFPGTGFGRHRQRDPLIPEADQVRGIQDQMTSNGGRDDVLKNDSWGKLEDLVARATAYIRHCQRGLFEEAVREILAIHRRLEERKAALESIREKVMTDLKNRFPAVRQQIQEWAEKSGGGTFAKGAATGALIRVTEAAIALFAESVALPVGIALELAHFLHECHEIGEINAVLKHDAPRVLDRLEIMSDLTVLIQQYELRLEANRELIDQLGKAYDDHKCRKCVPPGTGTTQVPGTTPRTGSR